jgi:hypothetical protein
MIWLLENFGLGIASLGKRSAHSRVDFRRRADLHARSAMITR